MTEQEQQSVAEQIARVEQRLGPRRWSALQIEVLLRIYYDPNGWKLEHESDAHAQAIEDHVSEGLLKGDHAKLTVTAKGACFIEHLLRTRTPEQRVEWVMP